MTEPFFILILIAVAAVAVILLVGLGGFAKGGDFNRNHANRVMRMRIAAQFVAVVLIVIFVWFVRG